MADKKVKTEETEAKDSGTESAGAAVAGEEAVEETQAEAPSEDTTVPEQSEAPVAEETTAEPEAATEEAPAAEDTPAAEQEAAAEPEPPAVSGPKPKRKRLPRALRHKHSKPARERPATRKPITRTPKPEGELGRRQERRGVVVSDKGDKTIVVKVEMTKAHRQYKKVIRRSQKFHAHDEQNSAGVGDVVRIVETRPLSKTKHWRLAEIMEKAR